MRVLKADLVRALEQAAAFNQLALKFVDLQVENVRRRPGFIPVGQYGRGMILLRDEIGTDGTFRFIREDA